MKIRNIILVLVLVLSIVSCRKEGDVFINANDPVAGSYSTYTQQFNVIWSAINSGYCFWDITDVDWDQRYAEMKPKFEALDRSYANDGTTVDSTTFSNLYKELVSGMKDHHMTLLVKDPHKDALTITVVPSKEEVNSRSYYHNSNTMELISSVKDAYGADYITSGFSIPDGPQNITIATKIHTTDGRIIPYLWTLMFVSFDEVEKYIEKNKNSSDSAILSVVQDAKQWLEVYDEYTRWITETPKDSLAGAIIDVRCNPGGETTALSRYAGLFTSENINCLEIRHKEGMGRNEMSVWKPIEINSRKKHRDMAADNLPVVVLADLNSASCAEMTALCIQSLPTGTFVGERTCGAHGPLEDTNLYSLTYGGPTGDRYLTKIKHFVYTSTYECRPIGKTCLEGIGVTPDVEVLYNSKGYHGQLQAAVDFINAWGGRLKSKGFLAVNDFEHIH